MDRVFVSPEILTGCGQFRARVFGSAQGATWVPMLFRDHGMVAMGVLNKCACVGRPR